MDDPVRVLVGIGRALDSAGVPAGPDRVAEAVRAAAALDPSRRADLYWAGRLTFCANPDDLRKYDAIFDAVTAGDLPRLRPRPQHLVRAVPVTLATPDGDPAGDEDGEGTADSVLRAAASTVETLRHKDVTTLGAAERAALDRALAALSLPGEHRPSRRRRPSPHPGPVDPRRTVRALLRSGGEPVRPRWSRRSVRPRPVVLLVDVSGSMSGYADVLLRFAHAATRRRGARTEVFTLGTRLTRVTREMASPDPERAMAAVAAAVPDWSGGTRLGALLHAFLDGWGQRGAARGAVVVIMSDGWERDDPAELGLQMRRLARLAHRVVWCNPRAARPGFAPLAGGMAAALPHVDAFIEGHSAQAVQGLL
ncbi:MAG TPA: VWA domain-containing protein, partial [Mycobacteriales bacterium]|nr:VWA domain-containing protein [Mycobacteriales bacterium]